MKLSLLLSALAALLVIACSDNLTTSTDMIFDVKTPLPETFSSIQKNVFDVSCALSGCHDGAGYPDLSAGQAYASIVDQPSTQGLKLVASGKPDSSYLYIKITGGAGIIDARMPFGKPPLPAATIEAIRKWIERGAPND